jgi:hypothetical protein
MPLPWLALFFYLISSAKNTSKNSEKNPTHSLRHLLTFMIFSDFLFKKKII